MPVRRRSHDVHGNLRPLRKRNPFAFWMAMLMVVSMAAAGFTALVSVF